MFYGIQKMEAYVMNYFYKYLPHMGDLTTYNDEVRTLDYIEGTHRIRFHIEWVPAEVNEPAKVEISIAIRGLQRTSVKAIIHSRGNEWDFQYY